MNRTPANKGRKLPPEPLTDAEVRKLIGVCSRRAPTGIRNRALIVALYRGGLRIAEALALRPKDLDAQAGTVRILEGKGRKARVVGLDAGAFAQIELWLRVRAARGINGHATVFCTLDGKPISTAYVRSLLPRLAKRAGIEKRVHAHGLRHTFAAQLRSEGVDVGVISKLLGHTSIATTVRYLDHVSPQAAIDAVRQRAWSL